MSVVLGSRARSWVAVTPPVGPQYLGEVRRPDGGTTLEVYSHSDRWVLKEDVRIAIAYGLDYKRGEALHFPLLDAFDDDRIYGRYADVLFDGQVVSRAMLLSVDGHRARLPCPSASRVGPIGAAREDPAAAPDGSGESPMLEVASAAEVRLARLVDSLLGGKDFTSYLSRSGIVQVPDDGD